VSTPAILARDVRGATKFFYAVIGVAGAMLLASSALWRLKGVKAAWTS
jgi:Flp pilus assembly pilin Flp